MADCTAANFAAGRANRFGPATRAWDNAVQYRLSGTAECRV